MKIISILIISTLIITNGYFIYKNKKLNCKYIELKEQYKQRAVFRLSDSVKNMNFHYNKPEFLPISLHATASVYFMVIGENNDSTFKKFNEKGYVCTNWSEDTKEKYKTSFLEDLQIKDFNSTHDTFLKGLDITDTICQEKNKSEAEVTNTKL